MGALLVAHGATLLGRALGLPWVADGYGAQYIIATSLGTVLYAFAGLLLVYKLARGLFDTCWLAAACGLFIVWNGLLIVRYALEDIARSGAVPLDELIIGQFTVIPRYLGRIVQILLTRE
nr:hypothetical protein [Anaerolineae bacterium]